MVSVMDSSYDIKDDVFFINYIRSNNVVDESKNRYAKELAKLCRAMDKTFEDIITESKKQQRSTITYSNKDAENSIAYLEEFDVNNPKSIILEAQNSYLDFCHKNGNSNVTINNGMYILRSFFKHYGLKLPKWKRLEDDSAGWERLTKEDFVFVMKDSSLTHQSLITFMLSTGIRVGDCLNFTIRDFMDATSDYHDYNDVEDFIDYAPDDMLGYWEFKPKKTKRHNVKCATVNSGESSNYILQNLKRIKNQYLPRKSKRIKKELKISKDDALFGSHHAKYKKPMTVKSITDQFTLKNHKLHEWRVAQIKKDIANEKYSEEDFNELEEKIPKFHAHGCRKYFIDILDKKCADSRLRNLMEGHAPISKNDKSYVKKTKFDVLKVYKDNLWECFTLEGIEVKSITTEEAKELQDEISSLKKQLDEARNSIPTFSNQNQIIWNTLSLYYQKKLRKMRYNGKTPTREDKDEGYVLCQYAFELAIKDIFNFKEDDNYLDLLFKKAEAVNELSPEKFDETLQKAKSHYNKQPTQYNAELSEKVRKVIVGSVRYNFVHEIIQKDEKLAGESIAKYIEDNDISWEDLDDSKIIKEILHEVIIKS